MRLLGRTDLAEDCVADTFRRFLEVLQQGNGPREYIQAYLYRIAHNWITDYYRRSAPPSLPLEAELNGGKEDDPARVLAQDAMHTQLRAALMCLTPDQRQVLILKFVEDWDNQTIAAAVNKPVGAVKALQHRALEGLRRILSSNGYDGHEEE